MDVETRHAWQQKHPTPTTSNWDFHWHPPDLSQELKAALLDEVLRAGQNRISILCFQSGSVAWAQSFAAVATPEQRSYTGLVVTTVTPANDRGQWPILLPNILDCVQTPKPEPCAPATQTQANTIRVAPTKSPLLPTSNRDLMSYLADETHASRLAHALCRGGQVPIRDAHAPGILPLLGRLLSWVLPDERANPRIVSLVSDARAGAMPTGPDADANAMHYLARAWLCPAEIRQYCSEYPQHTWRLVHDLCASTRARLAEVFAELTAVADSWGSADALRRYLLRESVLTAEEISACDSRAHSPLFTDEVADAGWLWNRVLNYWGRGFLTSTRTPDLPQRLSLALARRITADHLFHFDAPEQRDLPQRYLRRLRYEALLPVAAARQLEDAVRGHLPSLATDEHSKVTYG